MRRIVLSAFVAASAIGLAGATPARAARIYVIAAADTLDPKIGQSVMVDLRSFEGAFFAQVRDDILDVKSISGVACGPAAILGAIDASPAGADDTLVVYFSGHGAWDPRLGPYLKFPRLDERSRTVTREQIRQKMRAKGCRLAVLLTDTCNKIDKIIQPPAPMAGIPSPQAPRRPLISALFRALYLDTTGFVDVTSSREGELSLAFPALRGLGDAEIHRGGLFTQSLTLAFSLSKDQPLTWRELTDQTAGLVRTEFRMLKPNGLDNEDEPEKPQMTQSVFAFSLGTVSKRPPGPLDDLPNDVDGWTMGVFGFDNDGGGVYVWATRPNSPAASIGLERGDVILAIDGARVDDVRAYRDAIARSGGTVRVDLRNVRTGRVNRSEVRLAPASGPGATPPGRPLFGAAGVEVPGAGIRVTQVVPGSPAAIVGVDLGDLIRAINGAPVPTLDAYHRAVRQSGDEMEFTVVNVRNGRPLGMIAPLDRPAGAPGPPGPRAGGWTFGVLGFENEGRGLIVWASRPNSPAARLGLERGDLILTVDGAEIRDAPTYQDAIARSGGRITLTFRDVRTGQVRQADAALDRGAGPGVAAGRSIFGASVAEVPGRGLRVVGIVPNSPAARVEVDAGDLIVAINGQPVRNEAEYFDAVRRSDDEMRFTVVNVRNGRTLGMIVPLDR